MAKYFLHNEVVGETEFYDSWEELQKAYENLRSQYLDMDDGWDEEITAICAGEVTHRATMTDIQYPPKRDNFKSEEAYQIAVEEYGIDVDNYAYKCDYKLLPLAISSMPNKGNEMKKVTVRQARTILFSINCDKADILRRELFKIHEQDKPLTGDLLVQFYKITEYVK